MEKIIGQMRKMAGEVKDEIKFHDQDIENHFLLRRPGPGVWLRGQQSGVG